MIGSSRRDFVLGILAAAGVYACRKQSQRNERPENTSTSLSGSAQAANSQSSSSAAGPLGVPRRLLGKTGIKVSALGLGGSHIGQKLSERESINLIRRAIDEGITFLDNCWDYNDGDSEVRMGKALADGYRQRAFLMTKLDARTAKAAAEQLDQSLRRLATDQIDLVQIHEVIRTTDPDRCFGPGGTIEALTAARRAGKLRFIGFTGHKDPKIHLSMLETARKHDFSFDTVQMPLNVMDAHYLSFEKEVLPVLLANNIGVLGMKSLGSGDILKSGVVSADECLRYALSLPTSVVITGIDSVEVLEQNLRIVRSFKPLTEGEKSALLARTVVAAKDGRYEEFKSGKKYDGTGRNPHWLEEARI
jgi:aryl-alcohol dehydrogenase-like predicted oxidoreductase